MTDADQVAAIRELVEKHKAKALEEKKPSKSGEKTSQEANEEVKNQHVKEVIVEGGEQEDIKMLETDTTFSDLGVCPEICEAVKKMGYLYPSKIQKESLPFTLKGRDMIGLAETGSGKTAAFAIPVIQKLLEKP